MFWSKRPQAKYFAVAEEVLNELADCKRRIAELEKPKPVTEYEGDHERLGRIERIVSEIAAERTQQKLDALKKAMRNVKPKAKKRKR